MPAEEGEEIWHWRHLSREDAPPYIWGGNCDGWHLVQEPDLSVIEERMPPSASEVCHFHRKAQQFFFILSGPATMEIQGVAIPRSKRHRFRNHSEEPVRFLVISQPPNHDDRVGEQRRKSRRIATSASLDNP